MAGIAGDASLAALSPVAACGVKSDFPRAAESAGRTEIRTTSTRGMSLTASAFLVFRAMHSCVLSRHSLSLDHTSLEVGFPRDRQKLVVQFCDARVDLAVQSARGLPSLPTRPKPATPPLATSSPSSGAGTEARIRICLMASPVTRRFFTTSQARPSPSAPDRLRHPLSHTHRWRQWHLGCRCHPRSC